jgi:hypothetical protein
MPGDGKVEAEDLVIAEGPAPNLSLGDDGEGQVPATTPAADAPMEIIGPKVPNFSGMTKRAVIEESSSLGLPVEFRGKGLVRAQYPAAGSVLPFGDRIRVQFRP